MDDPCPRGPPAKQNQGPMPLDQLLSTELDDTMSKHGFFFLTVKILNFRTPENFAKIHLKFKQRGKTLGYFVEKDVNGIANSEDPDQTAPLGAV